MGDGLEGVGPRSEESSAPRVKSTSCKESVPSSSSANLKSRGPVFRRNMLLSLHVLALSARPTATWHNATSFGGHIWSAHETNAYIKYLGNFSSASACLDACAAWDAQPGAKCRALDWYSPQAGEPRSQGCYARIDGVFENTSQPGVTSAVLDWPCARDEDCSLNGVCDAAGGACACDPQWGGADCGELRLLPAPRGGGLQSPTLNYWGGNPFYSNGSFHVFGTELTHGCQIGDFLTNSQVVHATSAAPLGPYAVAETWLEPFAHTPRAWPGPNGSLLLAYVGRQVRYLKYSLATD